MASSLRNPATFKDNANIIKGDLDPGKARCPGIAVAFFYFSHRYFGKASFLREIGLPPSNEGTRRPNLLRSYHIAYRYLSLDLLQRIIYRYLSKRKFALTRSSQEAFGRSLKGLAGRGCARQSRASTE
jgi:hypothetical protein